MKVPRRVSACAVLFGTLSYSQPALAIEPQDFFDAFSGYCTRFPNVWMTVDDFDGFGHKRLSSASFGALGSFTDSETSNIFRVPSKPGQELIAILSWDRESRSCQLVTTVGELEADFAKRVNSEVAESYLLREKSERVDATASLTKYVWSDNYVSQTETVAVAQSGRFVSAEMKLVFNDFSNP